MHPPCWAVWMQVQRPLLWQVAAGKKGSNAVLEQQVASMHFLACISVIRKAMLCEERQMTYREHDCCCYLMSDAGLLFAVSQVDDHNVVIDASEIRANDHRCRPIAYHAVAMILVDRVSVGSMIVAATMIVTIAPRDRMVRLHDGFFSGRLFVR